MYKIDERLPDGQPPVLWGGLQDPVVVVSCQESVKEANVARVVVDRFLE